MPYKSNRDRAAAQRRYRQRKHARAMRAQLSASGSVGPVSGEVKPGVSGPGYTTHEVPQGFDCIGCSESWPGLPAGILADGKSAVCLKCMIFTAQVPDEAYATALVGTLRWLITLIDRRKLVHAMEGGASPAWTVQDLAAWERAFNDAAGEGF